MSIQILPPVSVLPWKPIVRHYSPEGRVGRLDFQGYRPYLRWEFGFSCAFCFLHESDLNYVDPLETGLFQIEHFIPSSRDLGRAFSYDNLFYVCHFCSRSGAFRKEFLSDRHRILNPCEHAWGERFQIKNDQIVPRPGDRQAIYTAEAFDFNDPRRQAARRLRRQVVSRSLEVLDRAKEWEPRLLDQAEEAQDVEALELAKLLYQMSRLAIEDLSRFVAIPLDADRSCLGGASEAAGLPDWLAAQTLEIAAP